VLSAEYWSQCYPLTVDALCPNCRNPIKGNSDVCIYCQVPLKRAESATARKQSAAGCYIFALICVGTLLFTQYPKIKNFFIDESKPTQKRPTHERTRSSKELQAGGYIVEVTGIDAYRNLEKAIQRSDKEQARKYVTNQRWKELELQPDEPNAITELNAGCPVDTDFDVHDKNDRTVLIANGKSELVKDMQGNPALKVLIVKMAKEDGQWKIFSLECHHMPPANYKEDALKFLDEQFAVANQDINSKLQAEGLRYGEQSCFNAIDEGNVLALNRCLAVGWDPNSMDSSGRTPLMLAAVYCKPEIAKDLIQAKAEVNIKTSDGMTALQLAKDCPEISDLLADARAH
jgi:hypothetical protein